jgi:DNA-binding SARP family transcriptional activator
VSNAIEPCPDPARPRVLVDARVQYPDGSEHVPLGRSAQRLLLFLALHDGAADYGDVIHALWPDVGLSTGRGRLRATLTQLHERCGPISMRQSQRLVLNADSFV